MKYLRGVYYCLITFVIYGGLNLLGWGLDDLQGFFALAPRSIYALIVTAFALAIGWQAIVAPEGIDGGHGEAGKRVNRQSLVAAGLVALLFGALVFLPFADRRGVGVMGAGDTVR